MNGLGRSCAHGWSCGSSCRSPVLRAQRFDARPALVQCGRPSDALNRGTGEVQWGRIRATPDAVREWAARFRGEEIVAVEACTGWLFVCEALVEAGATPHLAEPVETSALRGRKRRAKTDREDARWLRTLLAEGRLPEAWIPPAHVRDWRTRARLRKTLVDERTTWLQRVQAALFHHGVSGAPDKLLSAPRREFLAGLELPDAAMERIAVSLQVIEALDRQLAPLEKQLRQLARHRSGCRALLAPLRHRRADRADDPLRARLRDAPVGRAQGGALRRPRHRRAPLRPPLPGRQADQAGVAAAALGALRVSASGLPAHKPRPRQLPGAQGARALAHQGLADDRPQARATLLPHPARTRP
jgi:transposase